MEINITTFFQNEAPMDYSASVASDIRQSGHSCSSQGARVMDIVEALRTPRTHWIKREDVAKAIETERARVKVLREALIDIVDFSRDSIVTSIAQEALIVTGQDEALDTTAPEDV